MNLVRGSTLLVLVEAVFGTKRPLRAQTSTTPVVVEVVVVSKDLESEEKHAVYSAVSQAVGAYLASETLDQKSPGRRLQKSGRQG
jgi:hypothetical protein